MSDQLITAYTALLKYLASPSIQLAVLIPGLISVAIYWFYRRAGRVSYRLQILWFVALALTFYFAHWEQTEDVQRLYIYSGFLRGVPGPAVLPRVHLACPRLRTDLLSLWWVDITHALCKRSCASGNLIGFMWVWVARECWIRCLWCR
jgi:hypothetical protein